MRDYSFGNFLHELRVRRGLSQFQFGMLVGVSDKAVSKWENGSAKPQSRILYKLGEVLGITVDELLACRYRPENEDSKGVLAVKKALWRKAGEALTGLYGEAPPVEVANRFYSEYVELKDTDQILFLDFLSRLAGMAERMGGHMRMAGGMGASFVAFVLGASEVDPLRAHYYCPGCRKIQFADDVSCGWDLPPKKCSCGRELIRDGHNLPFETLRPMISKAAHVDVSISRNLYQAAEEMISDCFPANKVVVLTRENPDVRTYIILDAGFPGLTDGQRLPFQENYDRFRQYPAITLLWNEELDAWGQMEQETGIPFGKVSFTDKKVIDAILDGSTQGIPEFHTDFSRTIIAESAPVSVNDILQIPGLCHGTGVWEGNGQALVKAGMPIGRLMAYRDDVFRCIQEKMKPEIGSGTGYAFRIMEDVRRGTYARNGMPAVIRQQLLELGLPEWLIESFGKIGYLFPKAHGILYAKHAMILMWYKIYHREAFEKIIHKGS